MSSKPDVQISSDLLKRFGKQLTDAMLCMGISVLRLAKLAKVSRDQILKAQHSKRPDQVVVSACASALGLTVLELLSEDFSSQERVRGDD